MSSHPPSDRQAGMSLVETLVAVALLGSAVLALVGGLATVASSSDRHRKAATAETVVRNYTEALRLTVRQRPAATWCSTTAYDVSTNYTVPSGFTVQQVPGSCPASGAVKLQTVTLTATADSVTARSAARVVATVRAP